MQNKSQHAKHIPNSKKKQKSKNTAKHATSIQQCKSKNNNIGSVHAPRKRVNTCWQRVVANKCPHATPRHETLPTWSSSPELSFGEAAPPGEPDNLLFGFVVFRWFVDVRCVLMFRFWFSIWFECCYVFYVLEHVFDFYMFTCVFYILYIKKHIFQNLM